MAEDREMVVTNNHSGEDIDGVKEANIDMERPKTIMKEKGLMKKNIQWGGLMLIILTKIWKRIWDLMNIW